MDGVLTDGRIYLADDGNDFKVFDTKDGHGIKMAIAAGLKVAWISGDARRRRARAATAAPRAGAPRSVPAFASPDGRQGRGPTYGKLAGSVPGATLPGSASRRP